MKKIATVDAVGHVICHYIIRIIKDVVKDIVLKKGKIELIAVIDVLFRIDVDRLDKINELDEIMITTTHTNYSVKKGDRLAAGVKSVKKYIAKVEMSGLCISCTACIYTNCGFGKGV